MQNSLTPFDSMKNIICREVNSKKDFTLWLNFSFELYKNDPNWVAPLRSELKNLLSKRKNPVFEHVKIQHWIAMKDGILMGRITGIIHGGYNNYYSAKTGFFGYFDCVNDQEVSDLLLNTATQWMIDAGMENCIGPINLSTDNECGLLIEGFDSPPVVQMTYNPPYYLSLLEHNGFEKEHDLIAFQITNEIYTNEKIIEKLERFETLLSKKENLTFRNFNVKDFDNEVELVRRLFNDYMKDNWGFVPITKKEFDFMAKGLKQILIPDFAIFAEVNGEPVGFSIALPDINQVLIKLKGNLFPFGILKFIYYFRKITGIRVILMGVTERYRKRGLESIFYYRTIIESKKRNIKTAELSWISETNPSMMNALEKLEATPYKKYRIFRKKIC